MEKNWTKIFSSTNPIEVEILKQMLKENGIISIDINHQDSSYNMFGNINLYVNIFHIVFLDYNNNIYIFRHIYAILQIK